MQPLFKKFKTEDINYIVLEAIIKIIHYPQERRYIDVNDRYLRLSIRKAYVLLLIYIFLFYFYILMSYRA